MDYAFEDCVLSTEARVLQRGDREIPVQPKVLDLLLYLIANRGRLVSQAVLQRDLWPDAAVSSASLLRLVKEARRVVGDDGRKQACIKTVHGRGYRFVAPVRELGGGQRLYVGRERLLDALEADLFDARRGSGRLALLEGPPGIGKTSTLLEAAERARLLEMEVVNAWAHDGPATPAYWPWVQALRGLAKRDGAPSPPPELSPLLDAPPGAARLPQLDAAGEQFRLFDAMRRFLFALARMRPLALLIDDLHWADSGSLALLEFLEPSLARAPILAIGSYRPEEVELHPRRTRPLQRLAAQGSVAHWPLAGLSETEVGRIVEHRTGLTDSLKLTRILTRRTDGNPFFVEEILRHVVGRGTIDTESPARDLEALLPSGVKAIIDRRLNAISDRAESMLRSAAAIGQDFEVEVLNGVVEQDASEVDVALREAIEARLIIRRSRAPLLYGFSHPLIREHLLVPMGGIDERRALHLRIARAFESAPIGDGAARIESLAHHLTEALPLAPLDDAVDAHAAAARSAASRYAFEQSSEHYERALELLEQREPANPKLRCELLLELGELRLGAHGRDAARKIFERAAELSRRLDEPRYFVRAAVGFAYRRIASGGADLRTAALLEEALKLLPEAPSSLRSQIQSRLGVELLYQVPRERGEAMIESAVAAARTLDDPKALASALECQTYALWSPHDPERWIALNEEVERLALEAGDADLAFRGLKSRATAWLELGDRSKLASVIDACEAFVENHPLTYARWVTAGMHAMTALLEGRVADAKRMIEASRAAGQQDEASATAIVAQMYLVGVLEGGLHELEEPLSRTARAFPQLHAARAGLGRVYLESERLVDARGELESIIDADLSEMPYDRNRLFTLAVCSELAESLRAAGPASALLPHLEPHADINIVVGSAAVYYGAVAHHIGRLHLALGQWPEAEARLEQAAKIHAGMESPPWIAETRLTQARLYLRRSARGDRERARRRVEDALQAAEAYGLTGLARRVRATFDAAGVGA